jgi:hypothetical protein
LGQFYIGYYNLISHGFAKRLLFLVLLLCY